VHLPSNLGRLNSVRQFCFSLREQHTQNILAKDEIPSDFLTGPGEEKFLFLCSLSPGGYKLVLLFYYATQLTRESA
jgi:hypothetical protein